MTVFDTVEPVSKKEWRAKLDLGFAKSNGRTKLSHRDHYGPLQVQKPFYPEENGISHVYVLHPPGGVVGGDCLSLNIDIGDHAHTLITTPAAGKFYRSSGSVARQSQTIKVAADGVLEWFPSENIIFSGSKVQINTRIDLANDSDFIGWDISCFGRPVSGGSFDNGVFSQRMEIYREGIPLRVEKLNLQGGSEAVNANWGLMGYPVIGNMVCATNRQGIDESIRNIENNSSKNELFSVTHAEGIVLCRFLGDSAERAKAFFIKAWKILRSVILDLDIVEPRIWKT